MSRRKVATVWCRKRFDISWIDLAAGAITSVFRRDPARYQKEIERAWASRERSLFACLSVRSGWDLLLTELDLPAGSEVLMSAMTIPDMADIVTAHGLVPVPLELDPSLAAPSPETLRQAITPQSKIVLIAHLFGNRIDLQPHIAIAREHRLLFLEDCAQAYAGPEFAGHAQADASMFSFGNIKTATALGGGVFHLRDKILRDSILERQSAYPRQPQGYYLQRVLKYAGLKCLSTYVVFGLFVRTCRLLGINPSQMLNSSVRGFAATSGLERFRQQPCAGLLSLLARRLKHPRPWRIERQQQLGRRLLDKIQPVVNCPGDGADYHHFWVFPVLADDPSELIAVLAQAGFDATQGESMRIIAKPEDAPAMEPDASRELLKRMVYVPMYPELSDRAIDKLADVLLRYFMEHPLEPTTRSEPALQTSDRE
jgi:dTDP-4-amino-4,6-dideoxygalactose transaminase